MPPSSISGYVYYVSFIDDYSHKTYIYFLKSKDEVVIHIFGHRDDVMIVS
jgi:hypothetical protein